MISEATHHYHHGDLAETLMEAALQHIAAEGTESLSLRALAREAGVSATAPYRHFPSRQCLLAALATRGFKRLRDAMSAGLEADMGVEDHFRAVGQIYVGYALANPTSYNLMFGAVLADFSPYPELQQAASDCYQVVLDVLEELVAVRGIELTASELGGIVWAAVHGIASLLISKTAIAEHGPSNNAQRSLAYVRANPDKALETLFRSLLEA